MPAPAAEFTAETLTIEGPEPLKSLGIEGGKMRVGAYGIRFADASEPDLTGEYFTKATDFGPRAGDGAVAMFNHGQPYSAAFQAVCAKTFGAITTRRDETGIFAEATLDLSNQYEKAIAELCAQGKLKWSSGTAAHLMAKSATGEITRWHPIEFSFTPTPAEPRLPAIRPLKSLTTLNTPPLTEQLATAFAQLETGSPLSAHPAEIPQIPLLDPPPAPPIVVVDSARERMPEPATSPAETEKALRASEVEQMKALGTHFKSKFPGIDMEEVAGEFVMLGKSLPDLRTHVTEHIAKARPVVTDPKLGMGKSDLREWSLTKAIREIAFGGAVSGLEKEASEATAKKIGKAVSPRGFFLPFDVMGSRLEESQDLGRAAMKALIAQAGQVKNLNATTFSQGGALVGTELLTGSMIELLRNKPLVAQMGARTLTGLVGNVAIPQMNGGATAYWLSETGTITESDQSFAQLGLTPHKLGGKTGYTKELLNQSSLSVEALVRDDLMTILGIEKDRVALYGLGGAQPIGILKTTGINTSTFGATATRAKAIEFQQKVASANASRGALGYMTNPAVAAKWMGITEVSNFPSWLWQGTVDEGVVVGRRAVTTNQIGSDNTVFYGNWNDLILADWAGVDVVVNPYTNDSQGIVTITIFLWTDVGVRHAVSFTVSTDSGAQ